MPAGALFPTDLPRPVREGYGAAFENIRSVMEMEIGPVRRRNAMRAAPRVFDVRWHFSAAQFAIFDAWWQNDIKGGSVEFDVLLQDEADGLAWYTVRALGEFKATATESMEWDVDLRLRALGDSFGTVRDSGNDQLRGRAVLGLGGAQGTLEAVGVAYGSRAVLGLAAARATLSSATVVASLSAVALSVPATVDGVVTSYAGASSILSILVNGVEDAENWTISATATFGLTTSVVGTTASLVNLLDTVDAGVITVSASKAGYTPISLDVAVVKSRAAADAAMDFLLIQMFM